MGKPLSVSLFAVALIVGALACRAGYQASGEPDPDAAQPDAALDAGANEGCIDANLPPQSALGLRYTFDEDPVLGVNDESGNGLNGVCETLDRCPELGAGRLGSGFDFDSPRGDRILLRSFGGDDLKLRNGFAISLWVAPSQTTGSLIAKTQPTATSGPESSSFAVRLDEQARVVFDTSDGVGETHSVVSTLALSHRWHHIVASFDGDSKSLYVDGERVAVRGSAFIDFDDGDLLVGGNAWHGSLDGALDELRIYDQPLATNAVAALRDCF